MKKQIAITGLTLATLAAAGSASWALNQNETTRHPLAGLPALRALAAIDSLDLTPAQKTAVRTVLKNHAPAIRSNAQNLLAGHRKMRDLVRSGQTQAIDTQAAVLGGLVANAARERAAIVREIRPILDTAQLEKIRGLQGEIDARVDSKLEDVLTAIGS